MELELLRKVIAEILNVAPDEVTTETRFVEDLGADSLDLYQIVMGVEEAFDIELSEEAVSDITTVQEAIELIRNTCES
ncbi:MAG: acyl carrier protein [Lachnospiraceae bacterium]|jgi:acyl carrier protein|nr:acyl carrier protein [Lachnospiraceae bacterium]